MHLGMVGLGRMGMNMCRRLIDGGHKVSAYNRSEEKIKEAEGYGAISAYSLEELVDSLPSPRVVWVMLPAGEATEAAIDTIQSLLNEDDIIVEGGNSFYKDDIRRSLALQQDRIKYVDAGVSGGIWGLKEGYCLMVGGERASFDYLEPLFKTLAPVDGYMYMGEVGAGHFVKMVHNGIEYAMMEAYGEGFELLKSSRYGAEMDFAKVSTLWNRGSVIRSWLLELLEDAFEKDNKLESITGHVDDSGEGRWTVQEAVEMGVAAPAIADSLFRRFRSRQKDPFAEKVLAALRAEFGGHAVKKSQK
ncbi:MAG: decarboxylating 6-phosphogluconate dehydrogenase [Proteobacteria bacterium]|nr:decarboxylating 6-phosphogluconate dehydrogenase [Pseudomonadota bacterium]